MSPSLIWAQKLSRKIIKKQQEEISTTYSVCWCHGVTPHLCFVSAGVWVLSKVKVWFCLFPAGPHSWKLYDVQESVAAGGLWVMVYCWEERGLHFGNMKVTYLFCTSNLIFIKYSRTEDTYQTDIFLLNIVLFWAVLLVSYSSFCFQWAFRQEEPLRVSKWYVAVRDPDCPLSNQIIMVRVQEAPVNWGQRHSELHVTLRILPLPAEIPDQPLSEYVMWPSYHGVFNEPLRSRLYILCFYCFKDEMLHDQDTSGSLSKQLHRLVDEQHKVNHSIRNHIY